MVAKLCSKQLIHQLSYRKQSVASGRNGLHKLELLHQNKVRCNTPFHTISCSPDAKSDQVNELLPKMISYIPIITIPWEALVIIAKYVANNV